MRKMYVLYLAVLLVFLVYSPITIAAPPVTTGLVLDLDTSNVTTTTRGGVTYVTSWNDQSGLGNHAAQTVDSNQPILVGNATPTGTSVVQFDGGDYLEIVPNSTLDGGSFTMFAVYAVPAFSGTGGSARVINLGYDDIDSDPGIDTYCCTTYCMMVGGSTGGVRSGSRTYGASAAFAASGISAGYAVNTFYTGVVTMDSVSANAVAYLINSAGVVATGANDGNSTAFGIGNNTAFIGCGTSGYNTPSARVPGNFFKGSAAEILVYNRILNDTERASVTSYLGAKHMPPQASNPTPANGSTVYDRSTTLKWTPADGATSQTLYFSTDQNSVVNSVSSALKATLAADTSSYGIDSLQMSTTYYWRINHVANGSTVFGPVWSFTLPAYYSIENFENYTGTGSSTIPGSLRATWKDGYSLAEEGLDQLGSNIALVAKTAGADVIVDANFVRTLTQSMLFAFDNTGSAITFNYPAGSVTYTPDYPYAEAKVNIGSLPIGTDWTIQGDWDLILYFYGKTTNSTNSPLYLAVEDATGHICTPLVYPTSSDIAVAGWHTWTICSADLATNGVNLANLSKLYIGFGDRNNPQVGGSGVVYFEDIRMHRNAKLATDLNQDCKVDFKDFSLLVEDWLQHAGCVN